MKKEVCVNMKIINLYQLISGYTVARFGEHGPRLLDPMRICWLAFKVPVSYPVSCNTALSLGYIYPDHRTIFQSAIFPTIFRHRR